MRSSAGDAKSDVSAAYAAFDAAFDKGDAKGVAALYLPNAKVLPPTHEVVSGPAAIEKFFAGLHANGVTDHKLEVIDAGGDDKANWSAKGKDKDGKPTSFSGIATHVFERQADGSLKKWPQLGGCWDQWRKYFEGDRRANPGRSISSLEEH